MTQGRSNSWNKFSLASYFQLIKKLSQPWLRSWMCQTELFPFAWCRLTECWVDLLGSSLQFSKFDGDFLCIPLFYFKQQSEKIKKLLWSKRFECQISIHTVAVLGSLIMNWFSNSSPPLSLFACAAAFRLIFMMKICQPANLLLKSFFSVFIHYFIEIE